MSHRIFCLGLLLLSLPALGSVTLSVNGPATIHRGDNISINVVLNTTVPVEAVEYNLSSSVPGLYLLQRNLVVPFTGVNDSNDKVVMEGALYPQSFFGLGTFAMSTTQEPGHEGDTVLVNPGTYTVATFDVRVADDIPLGAGTVNPTLTDYFGDDYHPFDSVNGFTFTVAPNPVPEPATLLGLGGLLFVTALRRR